LDGVDPTYFEDGKSAIETALNCRLAHVAAGDNAQQLIIHTLPGSAKLPDKVALPPLDDQDA